MENKKIKKVSISDLLWGLGFVITGIIMMFIAMPELTGFIIGAISAVIGFAFLNHRS